jgi:hypothetical protein
MYGGLRRVGIPTQSYHVPLIYVASVLGCLERQYMSARCHTTRGNTLQNLGLRAGNSHDGSTRGYLGLHGVIPCSYNLTK